MKRFTNLFAILAMLSLGMGLSQALHHAVAHPAPAAEVGTCAGHCGSQPNLPASHDEAPHDEREHNPDDCAVCATIAGTKSLIPALLVSAVDIKPTVERVAPPDQRGPPVQPLRVKRSRAPPIH
jgi:hypothetical protein